MLARTHRHLFTKEKIAFKHLLVYCYEKPSTGQEFDWRRTPSSVAIIRS
jgi:hypothetical protein